MRDILVLIYTYQSAFLYGLLWNVSWMKFFSGKTKKEFEDMAKTNEYIGEAYNALLELSADEKKPGEVAGLCGMTENEVEWVLFGDRQNTRRTGL